MKQNQPGPGRELIEHLINRYAIDEWSYLLPDGFAWVLGPLTTQFTYSTVGTHEGGPLEEVRISTLMTRDAGVSNIEAILNEFNLLACTDAYCFDATTREVRAELSFVVHEGNICWVKHFAEMLAITSIDLANRTAVDLAGRLQGLIACDGHPKLGQRVNPDRHIGYVNGPDWPFKLMPYGKKSWLELVNYFKQAGMKVLSKQAGNEALSLNLLLPISEGPSVPVNNSIQLEVSAYGALGIQPHPIAGLDLAIRISIPLEVESPHRTASLLNSRSVDSIISAQEPVVHRLGAWYADEGLLKLILRLPSGALPNDMEQQLVMIFNIAISMVAQARGAFRFIGYNA